MAQTAATLTAIADLLKKYYEPGTVRQLNDEVLGLQRWDVNSDDLVGDKAVVSLWKGRSGGIGARAEGGALPNAGHQQFDTAEFDLKYPFYGTVEVTGPAIAKTKNNAGAFLQALKAELDGMRIDLKLDAARQIYADGTALIAQCGASGPSATVTLASAEQIENGNLYEGMLIDIGTTANEAAIVADAEILSVNASTPSITIDSSVTVTASHYVSRANSRSGTTSYELDGLRKLVSTSANTVGTIDASSAGNGWWDNLRDTTGGNLSLDGLMQWWNRVHYKGGEVSGIITTMGIQRRYFNLLQSQVRYNEPTVIKGGFTVLDFQGKPLIADRHCPWGYLFMLSEKHIKVYSDRDFHFLDHDGMTLRQKAGYDAWQAVMARYMNLGIDRRNVQFVASALTDTTGY